MSAVTSASETKRQLNLVEGQGAEIDLYGKKLQGTIISASGSSAAVRISKMSEVRAMRVGARVKVVFAAANAAAEVTCGLVAMPDHIVLEFLSEPRFIQRRRHERIRLEVPFELTWRGRTANNWVTCSAITQDVSAGGARVTLVPDPGGTPSLPPDGAILLVAAPTAGTDVETAARVVQSEGAQVRMEFIRPEEGLIDVLLGVGKPERPVPRQPPHRA